MATLGVRLAKRFRVVAIDRPGSGWSDRIAPDAASPAVQARIIRGALDRLGIARVIVVGHSWAGALATNLALDHADKVAGLVLLAPVTHPWPGGGVSWYYGPATSFIGTVFTHTVAAPLGRLWLKPALASVFWPQDPPPDYIETARVPLVLRPRTFEANAQDVAGLYAFVQAQSTRYRAIRTPTTILAGDADRIVSTDIHARALKREIPGAKLIVLPGVGHMPHVAAPDAIVREIESIAERALAPG
jgi:pimeloyl-ACP methyl ester carboxylesterase